MKKSKMMKSNYQSHFAIVPQSHHARSAFKNDHTYKTTFNAGYLIPFLWDEVNPGDTIKVRLQAFIRFATLLYPLMDNMRFYTYYFFVPNRLIWSNWKRFMGERDPDPDSSIDYTVPIMTAPAGGYSEGSIYDYFGLPTKIAGYTHISLPLRGFNLIYNEWFRDENLQDSLTVNLGDTSDPDTDYSLQRSNKIRDYFTSALTSPQKGDAVDLPLGATAPVVTTGEAIRLNTLSTGGLNGPIAIPAGNGNAATNSLFFNGNNVGSADNAIFGTTTGLEVDLTTATAATINDLREAFQLQRFLEKDARGGTRYTELVQSHFGVVSPDSRLQRPEYLGGSSDPLEISVVAQTSESGSTKLATLAGFGTAFLKDHGFTKSFTEHGQLYGLLVARADINYQQGLNRKWSRSTRYDYPFPVFAHLGEQAILNKEIYTQGTAGGTDDAGVFGYQERYAENRYFPNIITGLFRSNATGSLDAWHLAQDFSALPVLGETFMADNPPTTRVKATSTDPDFIMDATIFHTTVSTLPSYSVPGFIDHF